ncbi:MAG: phosphoglucosamine mutase [Alphaproteobacteria bacterium]|nr:phosphoglucosamine mutase [Alphaproteobacteria bacterium]
MAPSSPAIRFGTDGIRGPADVFPLDAEGMRRIGRAVAAWARSLQATGADRGPGSGQLVLGRDPRESGPRLADALIAGLVDGGMVVLDGGVMPTAAVSCAVAARPGAIGAMLTASHNPWQDNGVKVMVPGGGKLLDPAPVQDRLSDPPAPGGGRVAVLADPLGPWRAALPEVDLHGMTVLFDGAHGATAACGPAALRALGATVVERGCAPDGRNINDGVGALHPPADLQGADLAICLDGDGDRLQLVDADGQGLDGDDLLWLLDDGGPVVGTVMSNAGLDGALGGRLVRAPVGDRFVAMAMAEHGARIGGEPSGHMLLAGGPPTSCGLYTALAVLARHADAEGRPRLPLPRDGWTRWPQAGSKVPAEGPRRDLDALTSVQAARGAGLRVVVRYSGTEPVVRIMVEARDADLAAHHVACIRQELT